MNIVKIDSEFNLMIKLKKKPSNKLTCALKEFSSSILWLKLIIAISLLKFSLNKIAPLILDNLSIGNLKWKKGSKYRLSE